MGRRQMLRSAMGGGLALVGAGVAGTACSTGAAPAAPPPAAPPPPPEGMPDAAEALRRLEDGNRRWRELHPEHPHEGDEVRARLVSGQHPFATVLCCVDSRVPPELVYDQGLGDLLIVRTAGQVLDDAVYGSLQFGRAELGIPLIVVLGHTSCGAVAAAVDATAAGEASRPEGHTSATSSTRSHRRCRPPGRGRSGSPPGWTRTSGGSWPTCAPSPT
ncbi:carbonic anhydrase [Pseudonocardia sp. HH130630-07]|uniref:carbonic anhydrase n=1 Tax=Pseudonocardia sp. HH130630-07 TaxID=1690815 RepID=UPI0018D3FA97|nr:carbonic anhydrase [Pseudonocardia sp. HH130630-07]